MRFKEQAYFVFGSVILLAILYFVFDTKPSSQRALEKSRSLNTQEYDISTFQAEAKKNLAEKDIQYLEMLEAQVGHTSQDSSRLRILKELSGYWFKLDNPVMSGLYAKEIAEMENTGESWSIAGTSFASGFVQADLEEKKKLFLRNQAIEAFEKAISLEPNVVDHRVNQALCYIEVPEAGEPMKGIQMLAALTTTYPEEAAPFYHLARLAVKTGQYERAETRIQQALKLEPEDSRIACLAVDIYTALNKTAEAENYSKRCAGKQ